jgi:hypothetical protein
MNIILTFTTWLRSLRHKTALTEDQEDLAAFEERANEPIISHEELLSILRKQGKL